jgi:hypothetical protein
MSKHELIAELRAAAASLNLAGVSVQSEDFVQAELAIEDALFRTESLLARVREQIGKTKPPPAPKKFDG